MVWPKVCGHRTIPTLLYPSRNHGHQHGVGACLGRLSTRLWSSRNFCLFIHKSIRAHELRHWGKVGRPDVKPVCKFILKVFSGVRVKARATHVFPLQLWQTMSFRTLPCAQRHCNAGTSLGPVSSSEGKLQCSNMPYHNIPTWAFPLQH